MLSGENFFWGVRCRTLWTCLWWDFLDNFLGLISWGTCLDLRLFGKSKAMIYSRKLCSGWHLWKPFWSDAFINNLFDYFKKEQEEAIYFTPFSTVVHKEVRCRQSCASLSWQPCTSARARACAWPLASVIARRHFCACLPSFPAGREKKWKKKNSVCVYQAFEPADQTGACFRIQEKLWEAVFTNLWEAFCLLTVFTVFTVFGE